MMKDFCNKKCCLTCRHFAFWDGDYCCASEMNIHQFNFNDGIWMNKDIDNTMETPDTCEDYEDRYIPKIEGYQNMYVEEYKKWKEWDKLCYQLNQHVNNKWKDPKVEHTIQWIHNHYFYNI